MAVAEVWQNSVQQAKEAPFVEQELVTERQLLKVPAKRRKKDRIARPARRPCGKKDTEFPLELPAQVLQVVALDLLPEEAALVGKLAAPASEPMAGVKEVPVEGLRAAEAGVTDDRL
jgi:hypothetical protein